MDKDFIIYFADRRMNITGSASTKRPSKIKIIQDMEKESVETASSVNEITISYPTGMTIELVVDVGYYIIYQNEDGEGKFFTIIDWEKDTEDRTVSLYLEDAGNDLINEEVGPYEADKAYPISYYIEKFTYDSGFEIGLNELGTRYERKLKWEGTSSATKRIDSVATQFDHAELNFSFVIDGLSVKKKLINIYKKRGSDKGVTLYLNKDINNIITSKTIANLATALNPTGATPEGKDNPINLEGYHYDDGRFYVSGHHLLDRESVKKWSRYLSPDEQGIDQGHMVKPYTYETLSQATLCNSAVTHLTKISQIELNFEVDIAKLPKHCRVGDTIYIVDNEDKLYLQARILELNRSRSSGEFNAILGDYLIQSSGISQKLQDLADQIANIKGRPGDTYYPWVRYADDALGNGLSAFPANKAYRAVVYRMNQPTPSDNPADYEGMWELIQGPQGEDGEAGVQGPPGSSLYTWYMYADDRLGNGINPDSAGKSYEGIAFNKSSSIPSTNPRDYAWKPMYDEAKWEEIQELIETTPIVYTQQETPETPKRGDSWFVLDSAGQLVGFFKYGGTPLEWQPGTIDQAMLVIEKLISIEIQSSVINGSEFLNPFEYTDPTTASSVIQGVLKLAGLLSMEWAVKDSTQNGTFLLQPSILSSTSYSDAARTKLEWLWSVSNAGLQTAVGKFGDPNYSMITYGPNGIFMNQSDKYGSLTIESLISVPWETIILSSGYTVAEGNLPRYRKTKNLDGSFTIELAGQVAGALSTAGTKIIGQLSAEYRPQRTAMAQIANSTGFGGRLHVDVGGNIGYINGAGTPTYISLDGMKYTRY